MSTKSKKLYSRLDIKEAEKEDVRVSKYFSRKYKKRKTVQVRISDEYHQKLKGLANSEGLVMSFLLDVICKHFFKNYRE